MSSTANAFFEGLSRFDVKRNGHHPGWLKGLRRSAFQWVAEQGFPTTKDDAWKYTRVAPILEIPFEPAEPAISRRLSVGGIEELAGDLGGARLVVVNGYFAPDLSSLKRLPAGVKVMSLAAALARDEALLEPFLSRPFREQPHAFTALSAALAEDGALVQIPANTTIEEPIHVVFVSDTGASPLVSHPRSLVLAGPGILGDVYLTNAVTHVVLEEGAVVEHYKLQNETETAFHIALLNVRQGRGSRFSSHSLALGASTARHEVRVRLEAEGAEVTLNGLYMPKNEQHLDNPTTIADDEVLITAMEHHSNIVPWQMLCEEKGARLRVAPITDAGELVLSELEKLIGPKTKLVAVTHVSNVLGTVNPIRQIVEMAHARGARVLCDGAQAAPHLTVDEQALGCDFYALSGHKMYGPTGIGVLYGRSELLDEMPPYQGGGDMILSVSFEKTVYNKPPAKFEAGTPNMAGAVGLGAAVDFLGSLEQDAFSAHEQDVLGYAIRALSDVQGLQLIGTARGKASVISFVLDDVHPHDIGTILDREGIAVRTGHHCAQPLMSRLGVVATARASLACYSTRQDIDALVSGLGKVREVFR